ncbi:MAG: trehalose-phosphatase [Phycisphaerales bacterium]|jgi:trehalose-phosphatase
MKSPTLAIAQTPRMLVATDFDGTLAEIVTDHDAAKAHPDGLALLRRALSLPQTCVAIVSGRALADLRVRVGSLPGAWLVGSHGAEIEGPRLSRAISALTTLLDPLEEKLANLAPAKLGFRLERKPSSIAVHFREVDPAVAAPVLAPLEALAASSNLNIRRGKMVIELIAVDADKGSALERVAFAAGATATYYAGDDATDEDAFKMLSPNDLAVKVGPGETQADLCVPDIAAALATLNTLLDEREAWLQETRAPAIESHSMLSDQRTIAIVRPDAHISWMCAPRIDSGAIFASLLNGVSVGEWSVTPADDAPPTGQRYLGDTFTLETSWPTMTVVDYLDGSGGRSFQRAGRTDLLRVIQGRGVAKVVFSPRLDFGRVKTRLIPADNGLIVEGTSDPLALFSPGVHWAIEETKNGHSAHTEIPLSDQPVVLELRVGTRSLAPARISQEQRRKQTDHAWASWAASLTLPPIATDLCRRSALVLRALFHGPTGALPAAATSSLPETFGGTRNWDYRHCWPRDASIACQSLVRLGNTGVAMKFMDWLLAIVDRCSGPEKLRPIYTVTGEELGHEAELSHLTGYRASRPVRIGNAAAQQVQVDVFGPIVDLIYALADAGAPISPDHWRLVEAMAVAVERSWSEPDHGIWEIRGDRHHHVHSKVMCWMALDRATRLAEHFIGARREPWEALRDKMRADVLQLGYDESKKSFVAAFEHREIDAGALSVGLSGMLPPDDPRFINTVNAVCATLLDRGTVYRYRYDDALPGPEGGFHLCTSWLIESLALIGRHDDAAKLFDNLCAAAGPTGLLPEQWCPNEKTGMGNFPQAYSHAAIINSAVVLASHAK